ncbi:hypothetical protein Anas_14746, partial [Armadillidium nasatum]
QRLTCVRWYSVYEYCILSQRLTCVRWYSVYEYCILSEAVSLLRKKDDEQVRCDPKDPKTSTLACVLKLRTTLPYLLVKDQVSFKTFISPYTSSSGFMVCLNNLLNFGKYLFKIYKISLFSEKK